MQEFDNGAKRSQKRLRMDLLPIEGLLAYAERATIGLKYGENNWKTGGPEFFTDCKNHLIYHLWCWLDNRLDDETSVVDHLKAVIWNAIALVWWEMTGKSNWIETKANLDEHL